ncbi:hypothetical protein [Enemella sp. A6]|uniref:hypothetical protein n=1 Tax=Enemella sp. A6 TaxID=3440152 RepID=UPI003EBDD879
MNRYWGQLAKGRVEAEVRAQHRRAADRRRTWLIWYAAWTVLFLLLFFVMG